MNVSLILNGHRDRAAGISRPEAARSFLVGREGGGWMKTEV